MYRDFIIPLTKKVEIEYLFDYTCKSGREVWSNQRSKVGDFRRSSEIYRFRMIWIIQKVC
jgi:hypothetical protein